jgi:nucleoside-diphosphate kinase
MKLTKPSKEHMEEHYVDLKEKKFFPGLISYMTSGPVCAMVWEGKNVVLEGRKMLGATMPSDSAMGTIRGDFCIEVGRNSKCGLRQPRNKFPFSLHLSLKHQSLTLQWIG